MSAVIHLNEASFSTAIESGVTLVDFWAPWCGPCKMQGPILDKLVETVSEKATIAKLDVDQFPAPASQFGVRGIPTLILFKDGDVAQTLVGVQQEETLVAAIETALK